MSLPNGPKASLRLWAYAKLLIGIFSLWHLLQKLNRLRVATRLQVLNLSQFRQHTAAP